MRISVNGGTPFCFVKIKDEDIKKRTGTWQAIKRSIGYKINSTIELSLSEVSSQTNIPTVQQSISNSLTKERNNLAISLLPDNIIIPTSSTTAVALYRHLLAECGFLEPFVSPQKFVSQQNSIILSSFPSMMADQAARDAFVWAWRELQPKNMQSKIYAAKEEITSSSRLFTIFSTLMLHIWNIRNLHGAKPDSIDVLETFSDVLRRSSFMKSQLQLRLSLGSLKDKTQSEVQEDKVDGATLSAPFSVKELRINF